MGFRRSPREPDTAPGPAQTSDGGWLSELRRYLEDLAGLAGDELRLALWSMAVCGVLAFAGAGLAGLGWLAITVALVLGLSSIGVPLAASLAMVGALNLILAAIAVNYALRLVRNLRFAQTRSELRALVRRQEEGHELESDPRNQPYRAAHTRTPRSSGGST